MVSIESQVSSEKEWDLSFLRKMLTEAQELNDEAQVKMIAKRALEQAKKQGNRDWAEKFQAILNEYSAKIKFEKGSHERSTFSESDITVDLSEVKGIGESTALKLRSNGFSSVQNLASSTPERLTSVPGVGISTAQKIIDNAQAYLKNKNSSSSGEAVPQGPSIHTPTPYQKLGDRSAINGSSEVEVKQKKHSSESKLSEWAVRPSKSSPTTIKEFHNRKESSHYAEDLRQQIKIVSKNKVERRVPEIEVQIEDLKEKYPEEEEFPTIGEEMEEVLSIEDLDQEQSNDACTRLPQKNRFLEEVDLPPLKTPIFPSKKTIIEVEDEQDLFQTQSEFLGDDTAIKDKVKKSRIPYREQRIKNLPNAEQLFQRQQSAQKILQVIREAGMIEIPMNNPELREVFRAVDLLACKPMRGDNGRCIILLVPIKHVITEDPVYVWDSHVMTGKINSNPTTAQNMAINTHTKKLLQAREYLFSDMINGHSLISLVARYIGILMKADLTFKNQRLYLGSGEIEYQVIIDPVLLSDSRVYCMEKTLPYAYQQGLNLHVISYDQLDELLEYLEVKYRLLIRHDTSQNAILKVKNVKMSTFKQLELFSLPFLVYGVLFSFFLIMGLQEVIRFFISLGFGLIFVYGGCIGYLLYRHFHSLKHVGSEFSIPFYQKPIELLEEDFILINEHLSSEWMAQFSYEVENHQVPSHQKPIKRNASQTSNYADIFPLIKEKELSQTFPNQQQSSNYKPVKKKYQAFLDD